MVHCTFRRCNATRLNCMCRDTGFSEDTMRREFACVFLYVGLDFGTAAKCLCWNPPRKSLMTRGHKTRHSPGSSILITFAFFSLYNLNAAAARFSERHTQLSLGLMELNAFHVGACACEFQSRCAIGGDWIVQAIKRFNVRHANIRYASGLWLHVWKNEWINEWKSSIWTKFGQFRSDLCHFCLQREQSPWDQFAWTQP